MNSWNILNKKNILYSSNYVELSRVYKIMWSTLILHTQLYWQLIVNINTILFSLEDYNENKIL